MAMTYYTSTAEQENLLAGYARLNFYLLVPMASISSMNTIDGACSSATLNSSRTNFGPSPRYFCINSEPTTRRKVAEVWLATAFAKRVFPAIQSNNTMILLTLMAFMLVPKLTGLCTHENNGFLNKKTLLPVPGGPNNITPFGGFIPISS